jgi:putative DNA primase/helicase
LFLEQNVDNFNTRLFDAGIDAGQIDYSRIGTFQRLPTDDKPNRRNGAVLVLSNRPLRVWFQNHATGITGVASEGGGRFISRADWDAVQAARRAAERERDRNQRQAATLAERGLQEAESADPGHPYLQAKQVRPHGLKQSEDGFLLVPMYCAGLVWNLQTISPEGEKRFLSGGRKSGCYFPIGPKPTTTLLLCEGYATGASLYEATGLPVAVCFDCGNLIHVGRLLRDRLPHTTFIYAADNDHQTEGNPGVAHATKAASATNGWVITPQFTMTALRAGLTDWNDYATRYGLEAVRFQFAEVLQNVG